MKKLMLVLMVLALAVALIACGGTKETETEILGTETQTETETETEAQAHVHEFEDVITKAATCSARGVKKEVCKTCGEEGIISSIPSEAHTEGPAATCTSAQVCTVCNTELVAPLGHTFGEPFVEPSTCVAQGREVKICSVCQETEVQTLPLGEHVIVNPVEIPASCVAEGSITGKCVACQSEAAQITIPMLPHTIVPGSWDMSTQGVYVTTCIACQSSNTYTAESTPVIRLDFENTDLKTEIGADNNFLAVSDSNSKEGKYIVDGDRTIMQIDAGATSALWVDMKGESFTSYDLFTISYDFKVSGALTEGKYMSLITFVGGYTNGATNIPADAINPETGAPLTAASWAWMGKYAVDESQFVPVANKGALDKGVATGTVYPVDVSKDTWYSVLCIMNNRTGETSLYVNDAFVGILDNGAKPLTEEWVAAYGNNYSFRLCESVKGIISFDNFEVSGAMLTASERPEGVHVHTYTEETTDATCSVEGSYKKYCTDCKEVAEEYKLPLVSHTYERVVAATGEVTFKCSACGTNAVCGETEDFAHVFDWIVDAESSVSKKCSVCDTVVPCKQEGDLLNLPFNGDVEAEIGKYGAFSWVKGGDITYPADGDRTAVSFNDWNFVNVDDFTAFKDVAAYIISLDFKIVDAKTGTQRILTARVNGSNKYFLVNHDGEKVYINSSNKVAVDVNEWHKLMLIVDQVTKKAILYVDGINLGETSVPELVYSESNKSNTYQFRVGGGGNTQNNLYDNLVITKITEAAVEEENPDHVHTEVIDAAVAPTCTADGLSEGKHCSECNKVLVAQSVVSALGHNWQNASCEQPGTCSICNAIAAQAAGHTFAWVVSAENAVSKKCSVCDKAISYEKGNAILTLPLDNPSSEFGSYEGKFSWGGQFKQVADGGRNAVSFDKCGYINVDDFKVFENVDVYSVSLDFKIKDVKSGQNRILVVRKDESIISYFGNHNETKVNVSGSGNQIDVTADEWHTLFVIVDQTAKKAYVYVDGAYLDQMDASKFVFSADNNGHKYDFRVAGNGSTPNDLYDNFVIATLSAK